MYEIFASDENQKPNGIEPLATARTIGQAKHLAWTHAAGRMYGTVIVAPTGAIISGDETEDELQAILEAVRVANLISDEEAEALDRAVAEQLAPKYEGWQVHAILPYAFEELEERGHVELPGRYTRSGAPVVIERKHLRATGGAA
jgi:hypothetical protein